MLLVRRASETGTRFAWLPKWTPDGYVWLEMVRYKIIDGGWHYYRFEPDWRHGKATVTNREPTYFETPPDPRICKNLVEDGPTPCWYPHCECWTHSIMGKVYGR